MAIDTNSEAYIPVILSLVKLHVRSFWHTMRGGKKGLNLWSSEEDDGEFTSLRLVMRKLLTAKR